MADDDFRELDNWFRQLSYGMKRRLAAGLKDVAERVRDNIEAAAPKGSTGKLKVSVRVRRRRNDLDLVVSAGGDLTTKEVRKGSGEDYDYALGIEFGNEHVAAQPFFYTTWRAMEAEVTAEIEAIVQDVLEGE
jgi:hypothetical protein